MIARHWVSCPHSSCDGFNRYTEPRNWFIEGVFCFLVMKRILDVIVSIAVLLIAAPLMVIIAIIVATSSPGGALFRQQRIGRGGRPFTLLKFRTMHTTDGASSSSFDAGDTSRVTPIGKILRTTKLDELPQFINVLFGDMSLVGPRPEVERWTREYPERWKAVLSVRPGITDRASIEFRNEEQILAASDDPERTYKEKILPRKLDLAEHYVGSQSLLGDAWILLDTIRAILLPNRSAGSPKLDQG